MIKQLKDWLVGVFSGSTLNGKYPLFAEIEDNCINLGVGGIHFVISLDSVEKRRIGGTIIVPAWELMALEHTPGRWEPYSGVDGPEVNEYNFGAFESHVDLARKIGEVIAKQVVDNNIQVWEARGKVEVYPRGHED